MKYNISIIGNGAVGMFISYCLSKLKNAVITLYTRRKEAIDKINNNLMKFQCNNEVQTFKVKASLIENINDKADIVILCIKANDIDSFLANSNIENFKHSIFLTLQNGMGFYDKINNSINCKSLLSGINSYGIIKDNDISIVLAGEGFITIGNYYDTKNDDKSLNLILNLFKLSGLNTNYSNSIRQELWKKLCVNACINPITALIRKENGYLLLKSEYYEKLVNNICFEVAEVAKAIGIAANIEEYKESLYTVIEKTKKNKSSMLQDFLHNKITEIDYITGYIVKQARKYNIKTPYNETIYNIMKVMGK